MLLEDKNSIHIPLLWSTNIKWKKSQIILKFTAFLKGNLAENEYLATISNCECKHQ